MDAQVIWDDEPDGNVDHVAEHGLTPDEVDAVLLDPAIVQPNIGPALQVWLDADR